MTVPLIILAVLSTFGGLVGVPYALSGGVVPNQFEHILQPVIAKVGPQEVHDGHAPQEVKHFFASPTSATEEVHSQEEIQTERVLAVISVLVAIFGIGVGIALFGKTPLRRMPKILADKWRVDEF